MFTPPQFWCGRPDEPIRRVTWIELFFDLVFVAAVAQLGSRFAGGVTFDAAWRYALLFLLVWWAWNGYAVYATRFHSDDALDWGLTLLQMLAVTFMAANAEGSLDGLDSAGFVAAYAVMRLLLVAQYARARGVEPARHLVREQAGGIGAAALVWLLSAIAPVPLRYALWAAAAGLEIATAILTRRHTGTLPPDAEHLPERVGLFTLILFGESIVAVMHGIENQPTWSPSAATAAFGGLGLLFGAWAWYFGPARAAAPRRVRGGGDVRGFELWQYVHLPLYLGLAMGGVIIEHVVQVGGIAAVHVEEIGALALAATATVGALAVLTSLAGRTEPAGSAPPTHALSADGQPGPEIARVGGLAGG
jgi:low temperature requirement protein LtrA